MNDFIYIQGKKYKVITFNRYNDDGVNEPYDVYEEVCIAYHDVNGIETMEGLNEYEAKSEGLVQLFFAETEAEANNHQY